MKILKARVATREKKKDIRRTLRPLKEVWLEIGIEKLDSYEEITVKVLLDSKVIGLFMNKKFVKEHSFKLEKLDKLIEVKNIDGISNSSRNITHKLECNVFYKRYSKRLRMDVCNLERIKIILGIPCLVVYNLEIN